MANVLSDLGVDGVDNRKGIGKSKRVYKEVKGVEVRPNAHKLEARRV